MYVYFYFIPSRNYSFQFEFSSSPISPFQITPSSLIGHSKSRLPLSLAHFKKISRLFFVRIFSHIFCLIKISRPFFVRIFSFCLITSSSLIGPFQITPSSLIGPSFDLIHIHMTLIIMYLCAYTCLMNTITIDCLIKTRTHHHYYTNFNPLILLHLCIMNKRTTHYPLPFHD